MSSIKTYESDEICKKYRNRYKNLQKQSSLSSNPKVLLLYEKYKLDGAKILEKYQHGKITAEEFHNRVLLWLNQEHFERGKFKKAYWET